MKADRVAVLSDVHGVLPALEAVLAEPDVRAADLIVVTGDHVAGPLPTLTLELLSSLENAVLVRGNADRELAALARGADPAGAPDPISPWAAAQLTPEHIALLDGLPLTVTVDAAGLGPVLFCHATPRDDEAVVLVDSRPARWQQVFEGVSEPTVVCGHTHMPYLRLADRRLVVNPGSVGMPYGATGAHWALLAGGGVTLRRTDFDLDALRVCGPRDGRRLDL